MAKDAQRAIPLHVDWLNYHGALYACRHWHYTGTIPASKTIKIGVWEKGRFIGCVIFSRGSNPSIGRPFGLKQTEVCELTRIALRKHTTPVSKLISLALKMLVRKSPNLKLVISYADMGQGHLGIVYQAANWKYLGVSSSHQYILGNKKIHPRTMSERCKRQGMGLREYMNTSKLDYKIVRGLSLHKYVYPLVTSQIDAIEPLALSYPKN